MSNLPDNNKIVVFVDGEQREYDSSTFSEAAQNKVRDLQISNTLINTRSSELALMQMGLRVLQSELTPLLPSDGFTVVQSKTDEVESNTSETKKVS